MQQYQDLLRHILKANQLRGNIRHMGQCSS